MKKILEFGIGTLFVLCGLVAFNAYAQTVKFNAFNPEGSFLDFSGSITQTGNFTENPLDFQHDGSDIGSSGTMNFDSSNYLSVSFVGGVATPSIDDVFILNTGDTLNGNFNVTGQTFLGGTGSPGASTLLTLSSTTMALRVTQNADPASNISSPENGMVVYDSTDNELQAYISGAWVRLDHAGDDLYVNETGDTMTGSLNFSGVTNDITSATNEDITVNPAGTGVFVVNDEAMIIGDTGAGLDSSAALEINSDVKALLVTRVSDVETDIVTPVNGMVAYDASEDLLKGYINGTWTDLGQSTGGGGDITNVYSCENGDANACTVQSNEYLRVSGDGEVEATEGKIPVYNDTGATLHACTAVYHSGYDAGSGLPEVNIADADDANAMPAIGLISADIASGSSGFITVFGVVTGLDTDTAQSWTSGDQLFVNTSGTSTSSDCANTLTSTAPTASGEIPQQVGRVNVVDGSTGQIVISGADRVGDGSGGLPAGSGTEVQYRLSASSFGAIDSSSYTAATKTLVYGETLSITGTLIPPIGTAPTTDAAGEIAFDTNAWAASRGALQVYDGTANTYVVAVQASDTPTNNQVPTFQSASGTVTWEDGGAGGGVWTDEGTVVDLDNGEDVIIGGQHTAQIGEAELSVLSTTGTVTMVVQGTLGLGSDLTDPDQHTLLTATSSGDLQANGGITTGSQAAFTGFQFNSGSSYLRFSMQSGPAGMREVKVLDQTGTLGHDFQYTGDPCGQSWAYENMQFIDSAGDACICKSGNGERRTDETTNCSDS